MQLESQQQFVNRLAMALFVWIKRHPSAGRHGLTGLFAIDEAKDFLPGGARTCVCKASLMRLIAQARKYGLGLALATQNPKDVDYNALSQFSTQLFGRANSPQAIEFISKLLEEKGGQAGAISKLGRGEFYLCPGDGPPMPVHIRVPMCLTHHPDARPLTDRKSCLWREGEPLSGSQRYGRDCLS